MSLFTEKLIQVRNEKKMHKIDVAHLFGWTPMYYGRYENGYLVPKGENIKRFADFMGITIGELIQILDKDKKK